MKKIGVRIGLSLFFSLVVFAILSITALVVGGVTFLLLQAGALDRLGRHGPFLPVVTLLVVSVLVGTVVAHLMSRVALRPVRSVISATNQLASGDFSARLRITYPPEMADLAQSFNRMAEELGSTELFRSDFVNNFSHEFKTPIVSIKGFAEMLKYGELTDVERDEYLDVVISESARLASLATNVLNLTNVENQTALSDQSSYNLMEQIRGGVVVLQQKWEEKGLDVSVDGPDVAITANEELLSQVWLNLLDNAVKFSPVGGQITVTVRRTGGEVAVAVHNGGPALSREALGRIFDKFYQGDASRTTEGNGLGLTLAKKIAELHGGTVSCTSDERGTTFLVRLPQAGVGAPAFRPVAEHPPQNTGRMG